MSAAANEASHPALFDTLAAHALGLPAARPATLRPRLPYAFENSATPAAAPLEADEFQTAQRVRAQASAQQDDSEAGPRAHQEKADHLLRWPGALSEDANPVRTPARHDEDAAPIQQASGGTSRLQLDAHADSRPPATRVATPPNVSSHPTSMQTAADHPHAPHAPLATSARAPAPVPSAREHRTPSATVQPRAALTQQPAARAQAFPRDDATRNVAPSGLAPMPLTGARRQRASEPHDDRGLADGPRSDTARAPDLTPVKPPLAEAAQVAPPLTRRALDPHMLQPVAAPAQPPASRPPRALPPAPLFAPAPAPAPEPVIEIHIGRVDIRAQAARDGTAAPPQPRPDNRTGDDALAAYLSRRSRGARS